MRKARGFLTPIAFLVVLALVLAWLPGCEILPYQEPVGGMTVRYDFVSTVDDLNLPCSIYLPSGYDPSRSYPLWVELHALGGVPLIDNNWMNIFSNMIKTVADERGWIVLSPWGRNLTSFYIDGVNKDAGPNREPNIVDDMSSLASWTPAGGGWSAAGGVIRQSDSSASWKELVRRDSSGKDYAVRVRFREVSRPGNASAVGINLRRDPATGDCYHVDLYSETVNGTTSKYVRLFRVSGGTWNLIYQAPYEWGPLKPGDPWITLRVGSYAGYLKVNVNDKPINLQPGDDCSPYGDGRDVPEPPISGEVSICSYGAVHEFDELRIQNEHQYGERDVIDCILQAMEKFNIDEDRVYVSGLSMGGTGAYVLGIHNPGLVTAVSPNAGASDLVYNYQWMREHFPRNYGYPYADVNDARVPDNWAAIAGKEDEPGSSIDTPLMRDNSARYVLENLANMPIRIVQGLNDSNFPNQYQNLTVMWWKRESTTPGDRWWLVEAPPPYSPATAEFANGGDVHALLTAWSAVGPYYSEYNTSPYGGHGFMEPYGVTADFFQAHARNRQPTQVAYKTYDDPVSSSYWMTMRRYEGAGEEAALARAGVDRAAGAVEAHVRNVQELTLDLSWAGVTLEPGRILTVRLDTSTDPSAIPVSDRLGRTDLVLVHAWAAVLGMRVRLDGSLLTPGVDYTLEGSRLRIPGIVLDRQRTLTLELPSQAQANLLPNPGFEDVNPDGSVPGWSQLLLSGGTARMENHSMMSHAGSRSLRIKDPAPAAAPYTCSWRSDPVAGIEAGSYYALTGFYRTRLFRNASAQVTIYWYNAAGSLIGTDSATLETPSGYSTHDWMPFHLQARAPLGAARAAVRLETAGSSGTAGGGSVWFDDVALFRVP
ncbi:hypothetical protein [Candidatus Solincola sp.]|nr:alpha/beta hydrolase-fold protein [Actinomycetota bacterium]